MKNLTVGQNKFLANFLGNFSLAWLAGAIITPFFTGVVQYSWFNILFGIATAGWMFATGLLISKNIKN